MQLLTNKNKDNISTVPYPEVYDKGENDDKDSCL